MIELPVVPPKAIRQVRPVVPANVLAMLRSRTQVHVRISIDKNGQVIVAEPVAPPGGAGRYLSSAARNAALLWRFQPAGPGETASVRELVLQFVFDPN